MMAAENEAAGGLAVEPMGEGRVSRQSEPERGEIVLEAVAALRTAVNGRAAPCSRMTPEKSTGSAPAGPCSPLADPGP